MDERLDQGFSVFNLHVNKAGKRADREFRAQFGDELFDVHIRPMREQRDFGGIMAILHEENFNEYTVAWVTLCTAYVNEKIKYRLTKDGPMPLIAAG